MGSKDEQCFDNLYTRTSVLFATRYPLLWKTFLEGAWQKPSPWAIEQGCETDLFKRAWGAT